MGFFTTYIFPHGFFFAQYIIFQIHVYAYVY